MGSHSGPALVVLTGLLLCAAALSQEDQLALLLGELKRIEGQQHTLETAVHQNKAIVVVPRREVGPLPSHCIHACTTPEAGFQTPLMPILMLVLSNAVLACQLHI